MDLSESVEPTFGAPPLLNELIKRGDLPAVLNFWHYNARLKALGMQEFITVSEILPALGVERAESRCSCWVFDRAWAGEHREALHGFLRASYAAKHLLLESDEEWVRLEPRMKVSDQATATALRRRLAGRSSAQLRRRGSRGRGPDLRDPLPARGARSSSVRATPSRRERSGPISTPPRWQQ